MKENEILNRFAEKIITDISKERKVIGFAWDIDYKVNTRSYWPHTQDGPGYAGRVWIRYAAEARGFASDTFRNHTRTYPGTGGAGSYSGPWETVCTYEYYCRRLGLEIERPTVECYSWDYRFLFEVNQKELAELHEIINHENLVAELRGTGGFRHKHKYLFNQAGIVEKDRKFIDQVTTLGGEQLVKLKTERY